MVGGRKEIMLQLVSFHVPGKPQGKARARTFYSKEVCAKKVYSSLEGLDVTVGEYSNEG